MQRTIHKVMLTAFLPVAAAALAMVLLSWSGGAQKAHAAYDPAVEFSISAPGCNSNGIPTTTCNVTVSTQVTVAFNIDALPTGGTYDGYQGRLTYTAGLTTSVADLTQTGAGNWPSCAIPATNFIPGNALASCNIGIAAPSSTYLGALFHLKFTCSSTPSTQYITLVPGDPFDTHVIDSVNGSHSEATSDVNILTINCQAAPPPAVSVGGTTALDASVGGTAPVATDASATGGETPWLALGIAALAFAVTASGAGWYARRRWTR